MNQDKIPHSYNMAIIGNCSFLAYVDNKASVNWLCWPRMDDSFIFGKLLDDEKGGVFDVSTKIPSKTSQKYLTNTNILVTRFENEEGVFEVIDFAPRFFHFDRPFRPQQLFRKIRLIKGTPRVRIRCNPRGNYGETLPEVLEGSNHISYCGLHTPLRLTTNASKAYVLAEKFFPLTEDLYLVLSSGTPFEAPIVETFESFYARTENYWRGWVKGTYVPGIFQEAVIRSALALKLHQYEDTGAIIASGTTSLPEAPGSGRNWDYRYCWIRDTYFSLAALNSVGHFTEAQNYSQYILAIADDHSTLQPVYKIDGTALITESEVDLSGYLNEKPVRIGNQAHEQIQNDVYGQILLSLVPLYADARLNGEKRPPVNLIFDLLRAIDRTMDIPDAGIWELRGSKYIHLSTLIFHWAGAKAAEKIGRALGDSTITEKSSQLITRASELIERCWRPEAGFYASHVDSQDMDAAGFLLITLGYLRSDFPRSQLHLQNLSMGLLSPAGYIHRYKVEDDFGATHASFLLCHFWYAEALAIMGRFKESEDEIRKILFTANHVGLMSEDVDAENGAQWGNFPQTYSHVGLINAVCRLARRLDRPVFD